MLNTPVLIHVKNNHRIIIINERIWQQSIKGSLSFLVRFYEVSKIDPEITLYNYKDPIASHLFIYFVTFSSIVLFPIAGGLVFGLCWLLVRFVKDLIKTATLKGFIQFIIALVLISIAVMVALCIASLVKV